MPNAIRGQAMFVEPTLGVPKKLDAKEREMKERESHRVEELVLLKESHERGLSYRETGQLHGVSH